MKLRYALLFICFIAPSALRAQIPNCSLIREQYSGGSQTSLSGCNTFKTWSTPFVFSRTWNFNWQCQTKYPLAQATYQTGTASLTTDGECYYGITSNFVCPPTYTVTDGSSRTSPGNNKLTWQGWEGKWASAGVCWNTEAVGAEKGGTAFAICANKGCTQNPPPSPLLVDLKDKGFENAISDPEHGAWFKWGTEMLKTSWPLEGSGVGIVVLPGPHGEVDDASEMVGNFFPQPPIDFPNGFNALLPFANGKKKLDAGDPIFHLLRVWVGRPVCNREHTACAARPQDLHTLEELGITYISLDYQPDTYVDRWGDQFRFMSYVGGLADHKIVDAFFVTYCPPKS